MISKKEFLIDVDVNSTDKRYPYLDYDLAIEFKEHRVNNHIA